MRGKAWHLEPPAPACSLHLPERPGAGRSASRGVTHVSLPGTPAAAPHSQPALAGLLETRLLTPFIYSLFLNHPSSPQPMTNVLLPPQGILGGHHHHYNYLDHSVPKSLSTPQHQLYFEIIHITPVIQMLGLCSENDSSITGFPLVVKVSSSLARNSYSSPILLWE